LRLNSGNTCREITENEGGKIKDNIVARING
jgi:hypothetical protein